jgi:DNA-binding HxlR family transcriptional regulator
MTKSQCATAALTGLLTGLFIVAVAIAGALSLPVFLTLLLLGGTLSAVATTTDVVPRLADLNLSLSVFGLTRTDPWLAEMQVLQRSWALDVEEGLEEMRNLLEEARYLRRQTSATMGEIQTLQSRRALASADPEIVERPSWSPALEYVEQLARESPFERVNFETRVRTARRLAEVDRWLRKPALTDREVAERAMLYPEVVSGWVSVDPAVTTVLEGAQRYALLTHPPTGTEVTSILQSAIERIAESQTDVILAAFAKGPLPLEKLSEAVPSAPDRVLSLRLAAFEEEGLIERKDVLLRSVGTFSIFSLTEAGADLASVIYLLKDWAGRRGRESEQQEGSSSSDVPH